MSTEERGAGWRMIHGDCLQVMPTLGKVDHVIERLRAEEQGTTVEAARSGQKALFG